MAHKLLRTRSKQGESCRVLENFLSSLNKKVEQMTKLKYLITEPGLLEKEMKLVLKGSSARKVYNLTGAGKLNMTDLKIITIIR